MISPVSIPERSTGQSSLEADIKQICTITGRQRNKNLWIKVSLNKSHLCVWCIFCVIKEESNTSTTQRQDLKAHKQLYLQHNDLAGTHQIQTWMKDSAKAPPTQLLYVPLHAAEFIKLSMWGEIKAPVLGDFPLLAYCLNMTASVFEYSTNAWLRAYFSSDLRSYVSIFFTSMLVKQYI